MDCVNVITLAKRNIAFVSEVNCEGKKAAVGKGKSPAPIQQKIAVSLLE